MAAQPNERELKAGRDVGEALVRLLVVLTDEHYRRHPNQTPILKAIIDHATAPPAPPPQPMPPRVDRPAPMAATPRFDVNDPKQLLLRPRDACKALGIGERLLWSISHPRGPIPVVRIGSAVRYSVATLAEWIDSETLKQKR